MGRGHASLSIALQERTQKYLVDKKEQGTDNNKMKEGTLKAVLWRIVSLVGSSQLVTIATCTCKEPVLDLRIS